MSYSYLDNIPICIILYCVLNLKKKDYFWNLLICIGILPFIQLAFGSIYAVFNGSGLAGDEGGINSGIFAIIISLLYLWYIYIGAVILLIFSIRKKKKNTNEKKELSIIEKTFMISFIVTNTIFILNWYSVDIMKKPLFLYKLINASDNIFYGIGVTVEKISETAMSYSVDLISLAILLCVVSVIGFAFLKMKEKRRDN